MRHTLFLMILLLSLSCTSRSQAKRDSIIDTLSDSLSDSIFSTDTLRLLFVGDLMQHQGQINAARTSTGYDYSTCFTYVKEEIKKADLSIANLEVTLGGKPYKGYPAFSAPDEFLTAIHDAGFNVLVTANNHSLDRGKSGLERTIQLIDSLKVPHAGTYINADEREKKYPLLLEKNGFRIALLNYTYGTNGIPVTPPNIVNYIDTAIIAKDITDSMTVDMDDVNYSVLTYAASTKANAMGPSILDPRSGEILEADIMWWHNVLNMLQEWITVQTGTVRPEARGIKLSDELMGDAMRFVACHEVGHSLGLRHNMMG